MMHGRPRSRREVAASSVRSGAETAEKYWENRFIGDIFEEILLCPSEGLPPQELTINKRGGWNLEYLKKSKCSILSRPSNPPSKPSTIESTFKFILRSQIDGVEGVGGAGNVPELPSESVQERNLSMAAARVHRARDFF
jgi:hypothetical protein